MRTDPAGALDTRALDALRHRAAADPRGAARQAAVQFESLFTQMMIKSMRDASPKAEGGSMGQDTFTGMLDAQFGGQFAGRPGGLADMLEKQLTRHMRNLPPVSPANQPPAPGAAPAKVAGAGPGAGAGGVPAASSRAAGFLRDMLPHAQEAERRTGIPASFILGQAALESGWGRGEIRNADGSPSFNLFGIKATAGWRGPSTEVATTEFEGGQPVRQRAAFRSYGSYAEAFTDYARLLLRNPRYSGVVREASTVEAFAGGMQRAGYATDPQYADKLSRTIHRAMAIQGTQA